MKKVVLSVAIMSFALLANAQVLKKDLLKDYKPGDQLEKAVYGDKKEPIRTDSWNGAFSTNPLEGVGSPLVGKALSYKGYPEGGLSIDIGNFPAVVPICRDMIGRLKRFINKGSLLLTCMEILSSGRIRISSGFKTCSAVPRFRSVK